MMKFYIFPHGCLKLDDQIDLNTVLKAEVIADFKRVSRARFYSTRTKDITKSVVVSAATSTKRKCVNITNAIFD